MRNTTRVGCTDAKHEKRPMERVSPQYPKQKRSPGLGRERDLLTGRAVVSAEATSQVGWNPTRQLVWRRGYGSRYSYTALEFI